MKHVIVGCGYSGGFLAQSLLAHGRQVIAISKRSKPMFSNPLLTHVTLDITTQPLPNLCEGCCLHYFVPPQSEGKKDTRLQAFLTLNSTVAFHKVLYCSSSGVYGDHQGRLVKEDAECHLQFDRQYRRLNAEQQWDNFCTQKNIPLFILRPGGIYGPNRLPLDACKKQIPVMSKAVAPLINHIYVADLALIMRLLSERSSIAGVFNVSDGTPIPMGQLQQCLANILKVQAAAEVDFKTLWDEASPMKREFLSASKQLNIQKLRSSLPSFSPTKLQEALDVLALQVTL